MQSRTESPFQSALEPAGLVLSCLLLSAATCIYPELFLFGKFIHLPDWAKPLPYSIYAGGYLAFFAFLPIAVLSKTKVRLLVRYLVVSAVAIVLAGFNRHISEGVWSFVANTLFHYAYSMVFVLSWPIAITFAMRVLTDTLFHILFRRTSV